MAQFDEWSPWVAAPQTLHAPLSGEAKADIVIIGGGYTGLTCALALRESGVDVAVLEKDYCGFGASGRNAGHLTPTAGKDFPTLVQYFGEEKAAAYARFAERAVLHTESTIKKYDIDCDYQPTGNVIGGIHDSHFAGLEKMHSLSNKLGISNQFLDEAECRRRKLPPFVKFGVLESHGGVMNPGKYLQALRRVAAEAGVRIYEQTQVTNYKKHGTAMRVETSDGAMTADKVFVATNAYTPVTLGKKKARVFPLRVTLFRTKVLSEAQREALEWPGEEGIYTAHEALENYRLTADGRLSGGSKFVQYAYGSKLPEGNRPDVFADWQKTFAQRFAHVPDLEIETFWGGWIGMTLDFIQHLQTEMDGRLTYGIGFNGHGIAQGTMFGPLLADIALGQQNADIDLFTRRSIPLPPEPLRWLTIKGLTAFYDRRDKKVDADLAAQ